jgi:hypothetical protein
MHRHASLQEHLGHDHAGAIAVVFAIVIIGESPMVARRTVPQPRSPFDPA